uniref:Uncharacterized protein n=1 Tax=Rhizophora mucronata TaxID=61149 RepID=A0A2P2IS91_RHIMU
MSNPSLNPKLKTQDCFELE